MASSASKEPKPPQRPSSRGEAEAARQVGDLLPVDQAAPAAIRVVATGFADTGTRRHHDTLLAALDEVGPTSRADLGRRTTIRRSDMVAAGSADA